MRDPIPGRIRARIPDEVLIDTIAVSFGMLVDSKKFHNCE